MCPKFGDNYFGNVTMKAWELMEGGVGREMNKMIAMQSHEKATNVYKSWLKTPLLIEPGMVQEVMCWLQIVPHGSITMYGNDFGWGKPIAIFINNMCRLQLTMCIARINTLVS